MSHATANDPQQFAEAIMALVHTEMDALRDLLREEIEASAVGLRETTEVTEDSINRLAQRVANLSTPGLATPTVPVSAPVPFSGGTPLKKHASARTAYSNRDSKTILKVEEMCLEGVKKGYTFSGNADDLQPFLHLLQTRANELGFSEALFIIKSGVEHKLTTGGFNGVSVDDCRTYETSLRTLADDGDADAARLLREHTFLRTVIRHSLSETMDLSVTNATDAEDLGATYLRQLLHQVQGSHGVSLKNAQLIVETKKILDFPGCSMQKYCDEIKPLIVNLYFAKQLPIRCCYTVLQNLSGTMNDAFDSVRTNRLGSLDEDMSTDAEYNAVISAILKLTAVYVDEHKSEKWQQSLKAAAAFQAKFAIEDTKEKKDDKPASDNKKVKSKHTWKKKPPKEGSSEQKKVDGKLWKWCAKCSRWTLSHSTAEHTGSKSKGDTATTADTATSSSALPAVGFYVV